MSDGAILDVRDLRVEIPLTRGTVHAVDGATFELQRRRVDRARRRVGHAARA